MGRTYPAEVSINERASWGEGDLRKWIRLRAVAF